MDAFAAEIVLFFFHENCQTAGKSYAYKHFLAGKGLKLKFKKTNSNQLARQIHSPLLSLTHQCEASSWTTGSSQSKPGTGQSHFHGEETPGLLPLCACPGSSQTPHWKKQNPVPTVTPS